jgi:hypothetical protein
VTPAQRRVLSLEADVAAGRLKRHQALDLVHDEFGWLWPRYFQTLNACLDLPEALAEEPVLVNRLLRLRTRREADRRWQQPRQSR